jgi:hypothetical protein
MNREKSEAKFICIRDGHAFKMDLRCAGQVVAQGFAFFWCGRPKLDQV